MTPALTGLLDTTLGGTGFTLRHLLLVLVLAVGVCNLAAIAWNGRPGRRTCGALTRANGRCQRPMMRNGGCGIHGSGWVARETILTIFAGLALSLLVWNFEAAVGWLTSFTQQLPTSP